MHYDTKFGQAVYVCGNYPEIGNWNLVGALRLQYIHKIWQGQVSIHISDQNIYNLEYKYCIADYYTPQKQEQLWEIGYNRILKLESLLQQQSYIINLDNEWNYRKIQYFKVIDFDDFLSKKNTQYLICQKKDKDSTFITHKMKKLSFRLMNVISKINLQNSDIQYQICQDNQHQLTIGSDQTNQMNDNQDKSIKINDADQCISDPNCLSIFQPNLQNKLAIIQISEQLFSGHYIYENEVQFLYESGIKSVLCLQTNQEMIDLQINWNNLQKKYAQYKIEAYNIPIKDMDIDDICGKIYMVAQYIQLLIEEYGNVYIHCTAGVFRSRMALLIYYILIKNQNVNKVYNKFTKMLLINTINKKYISKVLKHLFQNFKQRGY